MLSQRDFEFPALMWELEFPRPESDSGSGAAKVGSVHLAAGVPTRTFAGVENKAAREDSRRWSLSQLIAITGRGGGDGRVLLDELPSNSGIATDQEDV